MAGSSIIGALRVVLGLDSASYEDGLKNASGKLHGFGASAVAAGNLISDSITAAGKAIVASMGASVDKVDLLGKAAQKAGAPIEEFSKLASSAGKVKIGVDELASGMEKLAKNMTAIAGGNVSGDAARAFDVLGVKVRDATGSMKASGDVINELAGKFENFRDGPEKTALAIAIFGKAGAEMIPLLNVGSSALKKQADEMENLGLVIDQKTFKAAEQFNQSLTRLGKVKDSIILKLTIGLLPALNDVSTAMVTASKNTEAMGAVSSGLQSIFKFFAEEAISIGGAIRQLSIELSGLIAAGQLLAAGKLAKAWAVLTSSFADSEAVAKATSERLATMWSKPSDGLVDYEALLDQVKDSMMAIGNIKLAAPVLPGSQEAIKKFIDSTNKSIAAQDAETQTIGMAAGAKEKLRTVLQGLEIATANHIPITEALRAKLNELGLSAEQSALKLAGTNLVFANKDPLTQYQTELANTEIAMRAVGATAEEIARNQEAVGAKFGNTWSAIGTNIAGTAGALSQLAGTFAKENKAMGIAAKAFGISQAIINTAIAVTKALATLPPPASYVAVGLAIATGAAQIATISAQSFAKGGSFMVPGGMSGVDNTSVNLNLASGERVDITPANEVAAGGRRGGSVPEIRIGMGMREFLNGGNVRELIESLNSAHADGYKLHFQPV